MKNYDKQLIIDYINGNDIENYDIDELEDDYEFMMEVINYTNDKKMYNFCNKKVKDNYEFTKFIITKFNQDLELVRKVADNYLQQENEEDINRLEISLTAWNITKDKKVDADARYSILAGAIYAAKNVELELIKEQTDEDFINEFGMGFLYIIDDFNSSKISMNFFAINFINRIFIENNINLENKIHQEFDTFEQLEKQGINTYLIEFIKRYDPALSSHICCNLEALNEIKKELNKIKNNWNTFNYKNEIRRYGLMLERIKQYIEENNCVVFFNQYEIIHYIGKQLGIDEKIKKYGCFDKEVYEEIIENTTISKNKMSVVELKHYYKIEEIITDLIQQKVVEEPKEYEDKPKKEKTKTKLIKVDFSNKN